GGQAGMPQFGVAGPPAAAPAAPAAPAAAPAVSLEDRLMKLASLKEKGLITEAEFTQRKGVILAEI
ncbi:MAG: SHOCT domain-containing protein, partial [Polyangiaceae bacterium]